MTKVSTIEMTMQRFMRNFNAMESARAGSTTPAGWYRALSASLADLEKDHSLLPKEPDDAVLEAICKELDPEYGAKTYIDRFDGILMETDEQFAARLLATRAQARRIYAAIVKP